MKFPRNDKRKVRASVEMTPLIDVVFQLLIFFMLSSTFVVQSSIPIEMPEAQGANQLEHKELSITLGYGNGGPDDEGPIWLDDVAIMEWDELQRALVAFKEKKSDALVLIRPDQRITSQRLIKVLGIANAVGIQHYGIAAQNPSEQQ